MWVEAGLDPEPLPKAMLREWVDAFARAKAADDLMGMRRAHQSVMDLLGYIRPGKHNEPRDVWEDLERELATAGTNSGDPATPGAADPGTTA